ncbi:MAG TPA: hypothetical protein PK299_00410 [Anaerolineales bacterium]|nr:hypothetical protein [Anaerolineales bacterium]
MSTLDSTTFATNQSGQLTNEQQQLVVGEGTQAVFTSGCATWGIVVGIVFFLAFLVTAGITFVLSSGVLPIEKVNFNPMAGFIFIVPIILFSAFLVLLFNGWRWLQLRNDVKNRRIDMAEGIVKWQGNRYQGIVNGKKLTLSRNSELRPGYHYTICYLPNGKYALSAVQGHPTGDPNQDYQTILAKVLKFRVDELNDARNGNLSSAVRSRALMKGLLSLLGWGIFVLLFAGGFVYAFLSNAGGGETDIILLVVALILVGSLGWVLFLLFRDVYSLIRATGVLPSEGLVGKYTRTTGSGRSRSTSYFYTLNGTSFKVSSRAYYALVPGLHRIYALNNRPDFMVGIEPL